MHLRRDFSLIREIRAAYPNVGQRTLAAHIVARRNVAPFATRIASLNIGGLGGRTQASVYSTIRTIDRNNTYRLTGQLVTA